MSLYDEIKKLDELRQDGLLSEQEFQQQKARLLAGGPVAPVHQGTRDPTTGREMVCPRTPPISAHLALLTLMMPGLPQLIFGQAAKGIVMCIAFWASIPTVIGPLLILVAALVDAYMVGGVLKRGNPVGKWQFFPSS